MKALRAFVTIGIAALWLAFVAPPMFMTPPAAYTGVHFAVQPGIIRPNVIRVDPGSPAYRAGLRNGDVLGCLSSADFDLLFLPSEGYTEAYSGRPVSACVHRNGVLTRVRFLPDARGTVPNAYHTDLFGFLRLFVVLVFFITGIALVMARPSPMTWLFYGYCITNAPAYAGLEVLNGLPTWQFILSVKLPEFANWFGTYLLLQFSLLVPDLGIPRGWRRTAFYAASALALAGAALSVSGAMVTSFHYSASFRMTLDAGLTALTVLVVFIRLIAMERTERARFGWAAFAIISGVITNDLRNVLSLVPGHVQNDVSIVAAELTIVMPIALMYGILRRHVIDVRFVISKGVVYAALTTLVVGVIGVVDWLTSSYLREAKAAMAIDAAVTIGLAFALHRAYRWIESGVDFVLFRRKHEAERYLRRLAHTLSFAQTEEAVDAALVHDPYERLDLTAAALYRLRPAAYVPAQIVGWNASDAPTFGVDHDLVRFLLAERAKISVADLRPHIAASFRALGGAPAIAVPLFQNNRLTAFALYGIHRDGTRLDPDEIETLEHLCAAGAQAYTGLELARYQGVVKAPLAMEAL